MELSRRATEQKARETFIIDKAIELFCEYGFEHVSMDLIAKEAEFTKRTIYRYFQSKEELYFAAAYRGHEYLYAMLTEAIDKGTTGYDKIRLAYYAYYEYWKKHSALAQLVNERQYTKLNNSATDSFFYKQFMNLDKQIFDKLLDIYHLGFADKSIHAEGDVEYLTYSSIYSAVSFFQLYRVTGESYTRHLGLNSEKFVTITIEQMLSQIKGK